MEGVEKSLSRTRPLHFTGVHLDAKPERKRSTPFLAKGARRRHRVRREGPLTVDITKPPLHEFVEHPFSRGLGRVDPRRTRVQTLRAALRQRSRTCSGRKTTTLKRDPELRRQNTWWSHPWGIVGEEDAGTEAPILAVRFPADLGGHIAPPGSLTSEQCWSRENRVDGAGGASGSIVVARAGWRTP